MLEIMLFDIDGVLLTGEPWHRYLERDYGINQEMRSTFFRKNFPACLIGQADLKVELADYLLTWRWPGSVEDFLQYWFESAYEVNTPLIAQVQLLRRQGISCYLATQQERYRTAHIIEKMGFAQDFDGMFSSYEIGYLKNNPLFFKCVLERLAGIQPQNILFWDDTPDNVEAARGAGLQAELYSSFVSFQHTMTTYI